MSENLKFRDPQEERWASASSGLENLGFSSREIKRLFSGPARVVVAIATLGSLAAACKSLEQPTAELPPTVPPTVRPTDIPAPTVEFTPEPTATSFPRPEVLEGMGGRVGGRFDEESMARFETLILPRLAQETGLTSEEIIKGKFLPVQEGINAAFFFRGDKKFYYNVWHFSQNDSEQGYEVRLFSAKDTIGLTEVPGKEKEPSRWENSIGQTFYEVKYLGIGKIISLKDLGLDTEGFYWQLDDHFLPLKGIFDYGRLAKGFIAVENPATLKIEIRTLAGDLVVGVFDPLAGEAGEWIKKPGADVFIPEPTPTPEIRPVKMGQIMLEDQSTRMDIQWKDENSMGKVQEAFLIMWARKAGTTPEAVRARMAKGEKVTGFATYIVLDQEGKGVNTVTQKVDLSKSVKIVVWDNPIGLGSSAAARIQLSVSGESLTVFIYNPDNVLPETAVIGGVMEALGIVYNNGRPSFQNEPNFPQVESLMVEVEKLLVSLSSDGKKWVPEIESLRQ